MVWFQPFAKAGEDAEALIAALASTKVIPFWVHGDFVFRNIHLDGARLGLFDFANTLTASHPLIDLYNLRVALGHKKLSSSLKALIWTSLLEGFGEEVFSEAEHAFFHGFHRRRWLMRNRTGGRRFGLLRAPRGIYSYARPWREVREELLP